MKKQDKNPNKPLDKRHYKRKYILRKHEENEANQEIKKYQEDNINENDKEVKRPN